MKKQLLKIVFLWLAVGMTACMNPGIEVGNPDLEGKSVTLKAQDSETLYAVNFDASDNADASQIEGNQVETLSVTYEYNFPDVHLQVTFSDQTTVEISLTVNQAGEFIDSVLKINGHTLPSSIQSQSQGSSFTGGAGDACLSGSDNAGIEITDALCAQIVTCLGDVSCVDCRSAVLNLPGLGFDFGGNSGESMSATAQEIDNGQWDVDATALDQCLSDIPLVPCPTVATAVTGEPPTDYSNLRSMIPKPACARGVLKQKNPGDGGSGNGNSGGNGNGSGSSNGKANGKANGP